MKKRYIILSFLLTLVFGAVIWMNHCNQKNLETLRKDFTKEELRYFYECVFHSDKRGKNWFSQKWSKDIYIHMADTNSLELKSHVEYAIQYINELELPIKAFYTDSKNKANLFIYFNPKRNNPHKNRAEFFTYSFLGNITSAKVDIFKQAYDSNLRATILEEIIQCLGIVGDGVRYRSSLFYEAKMILGKPYTNTGIEIDKRIIKLLYDDRIPYFLKRKCYEKAFGNILGQEINIEGVLEYQKKYNLDVDFFEKIKKTCFINGVFLKLPYEIPLSINNKENKDSLGFINPVVQQVNNLSDNFNLFLIEKDSIFPRFEIIFKNDSIKESEKVALNFNLHKTEGVLPLRERVNIEVSIKEQYSLEDKIRISESIFKILGPCFARDELVFNENLEFVYAYPQILDFLYSDFIPDEMTLEEYDKILDIIKNN